MIRQIRVLCVDDHAFLAEGLKARFDMEEDIRFIGRLASAENLLAEARRLKPDVVLLDIEMPGPDPFEVADDIRRQLPETRVMILSAHVRDHYLSAALKAGAWGYFSKSDEPNDIVQGIRTAARGEFVFGPQVAARCRPQKRSAEGEHKTPTPKLDALTAREQEVLRLIGRGMSRAEIAKAICRSPKTVDGHRERIMGKLDIHSGPDLIRFAIREGLVEA